MESLHNPLLNEDKKDHDHHFNVKIIQPNLCKRLAGEIIGTSLLLALGCGCTMSNVYLLHNPIEVRVLMISYDTSQRTFFTPSHSAHFPPL